MFSLLEVCGSFLPLLLKNHTVCLSLFTLLSKQQVTYYIYVGAWRIRAINLKFIGNETALLYTRLDPAAEKGH